MMQTFGLKDEHIKLGQLLKATGLVGSGVDAKIVVQEGLVKVNGKVCYMRGKKIVINMNFHHIIRQLFYIEFSAEAVCNIVHHILLALERNMCGSTAPKIGM